MIITCGTDIIEVSRIKEAIERLGDSFLDKIYTPLEVEYCKSKGTMQYQHFAARFAAKEAIFKAMSSLLNDKYDITWLDIEICHNKMGKPCVKLLNKEFDKIEQIDISLAHIKEYAVANCVVVSKDD